jgi:hypothetical protein
MSSIGNGSRSRGDPSSSSEDSKLVTGSSKVGNGGEAMGGVACFSLPFISTSALLLLAGSTAASASMLLETFLGSEEAVALEGLRTPPVAVLGLGGEGVNSVGWKTSYLVDHLRVFS